MITLLRIMIGLVLIMFSPMRLRAQLFERVDAATSGLRFSNNIRETDDFNVLADFYAYNGGGVAAGDVDGDGLIDLYFTGTQVGDRLYINKGNFRFVDVTFERGIRHDSIIPRTGVLLADLNADGFLDLYICRRPGKSLYYVNDGRGYFTLADSPITLTDSTSATMAAPIDIDADGDLDLFVMRSGKSRRQGHMNPGENDNVFRNDGNGIWVDVTAAAGIVDRGYGLGLSIGDVNGDGFADVFVANDFEERDRLWINNGNGSYRNDAMRALRNMSWSSMGSDIADLNSDGRLDILSMDMLPKDHFRRMTQVGGMSIYGPFFDSAQRIHNAIHINRGNGLFTNVCYLSGLAATDWTWSVLTADYDLDGFADVFISNGVKRDIGDQDFVYNYYATTTTKKDEYQKMPITNLRNALFLGTGSLIFRDVSDGSGIGDSIITNGAAYADLDNDGDLDVVLNNTDHVAGLYRNMTVENHRRRSLKVILQGPPSDRLGHGAHIRVVAGDRTYAVSANPVHGYLSSSHGPILVGLDDRSKVDTIEVTWSDRSRTVLTNVNIASAVVAQHSNAKEPRAPFRPLPAFTDVSSRLPARHRENFYDDLKRERLLPYRYSQEGPDIGVGDVNGDGLYDVVMPGAKFQYTELYLQQGDGSFVRAKESGLTEFEETEDVSATLFDADADGDLDVYIVTGSAEFEPDDEELRDRLYRNNGSGVFTLDTAALPPTRRAGSRVAVVDINNDGFRDLVVGGRIRPGRFPDHEPTAILRNTGKKFIDVTSEVAPGMSDIGMTRDVVALDVDGDGDADVMTVGEWSAPRLWINEKGKLVDRSTLWGLDSLTGWWRSATAGDVDGDGDVDVVLGNIGLNCRILGTPEEPLQMHVADFDGNGSLDQIVSYVPDGVRRPTRSRMNLIQHIPTLVRSFNTYADLARASLRDVLPNTDGNVRVYSAGRFDHILLRNQGGRFTHETLPELAQVFPVNDAIIADVNADGLTDIVLVGNERGMDADVISYDNGLGEILLGTTAGQWQPWDIASSGFIVPGTARSVDVLPAADGGSYIIVGVNDGPVRLFQLPSMLTPTSDDTVKGQRGNQNPPRKRR